MSARSLPFVLTLLTGAIISRAQAQLPPLRSFTGTWVLEFALSALDGKDLKKPPRPVRATLELLLSDNPDHHLDGRADLASMAMLLGRPISCVGPRSRPMAYFSQDSLTIWFTPGSGDCGLLAQFTTFGDTLLGTWSEPGFGRDQAHGALRAWRHPG